MPGKEENAGIVWRTLQGVYRGCLRSGRGTRARVYVRAAPRNGLGGAEGAGKKADSGEPKLRECETGLGHGERASAGTNRRNHTPDGVWDEPRTRGLGASAEVVRRSGDEDCALRASRKREDAEQALGYMNRRALERGRRSGLKEQEESWCGAVSPFDGARARERYPLLEKDPLRGQKSSICEECRKANFLLKKMTWGNAGRSASERFPSDPRTHISPIIVHRALFFEKKGGGKAGWRKDGVLDVGESTRFSRAVMTSAIPPMRRGMTNHRHAVSAMPLTHHKPKCHVPCF